MIDRDHGPSVSRQAKVLGISRGSVHYLPRPTSDADLALMRRIDELDLEYPFAGSRMLKGLLQAEGHEVGRLHVSTLMKRMAIEALYRRPNTSKPAPGHKVYPYLLRKLTVTDAEPRLGHGHHLHSDGPRRSASVSTDGDQSLTLSRRGGRLVQPQGPGMAAVDHALGRLLHRGAGGGARAPRPAGDFNSDQGSQGGLNRSSQRFQIARSSAVRPGLRRVFSNPASFAVCR